MITLRFPELEQVPYADRERLLLTCIESLTVKRFRRLHSRVSLSLYVVVPAVAIWNGIARESFLAGVAVFAAGAVFFLVWFFMSIPVEYILIRRELRRMLSSDGMG